MDLLQCKNDLLRNTLYTSDLYNDGMKINGNYFLLEREIIGIQNK